MKFTYLIGVEPSFTQLRWRRGTYHSVKLACYEPHRVKARLDYIYL